MNKSNNLQVGTLKCLKYEIIKFKYLQPKLFQFTENDMYVKP